MFTPGSCPRQPGQTFGLDSTEFLGITRCLAPAPMQPPAPQCGVELQTRLSRFAQCRQNITFGCRGTAFNASTWVSSGCRGVFICNGAQVECGFPGQLHASTEWCRCIQRRHATTQLEACPTSAAVCNVATFRSPAPPDRCGAARRIGADAHSRTVIVAVRFNEDLRAICWLASLPADRVYLINKGTPLSAKGLSHISPRVVELRAPNIARESYSYLHALLHYHERLCSPRNARIIFMQANHRNPMQVASWVAGVVAANTTASCFSYCGELTRYAYSLHTSAGGLLYDALRLHYRSKHVCPEEDWDEFTRRTSYAGGATFAISVDRACSLTEASLRSMQEEINASWTPPSGKHLKEMFPLGVHKMEFIYERSWERLMNGCANAPLPPCGCACSTGSKERTL